MADDEQPSALDRHFASLINRLADRPGAHLELAALLASQDHGKGNTCLPLKEIAGRVLPVKLAGFDRIPKASSWAKELRLSGIVGAPGELKPLILDDDERLYLRRYWEYEQELAASIKERLRAEKMTMDAQAVERIVCRYFPGKSKTDSQRVAATRAATAGFTVITGGPGTGKTWTVVIILALLLELADKPLRIALTAASGKAAARLKESIETYRDKLDCPPEIRELLPTDSSTIHRLLGVIPDSPYFRHNANHPLQVDVVIVDEASMVDLALMTKLLAATPKSARVILLGDKDQLASVDAGYVLGDICHPSEPTAEKTPISAQINFAFSNVESDRVALRESIVELRENYRFTAESGIFQLVEAVNRGDADRAMAILRSDSYPDVTWKVLPKASNLVESLSSLVITGFKSFLRALDPEESLRRFSEFRVICAARKGPFGVGNLNEAIESALRRAGLLEGASRYYFGRPLLITRNDYHAGLFNGDIGVTAADPENPDEARVFFASPKGTMRRFYPSRLPVHETAFAMTVHKSQGSEFDRVLFILPDKDSPLLTRELIYTGLTRARAQVEIWTPEEILCLAISERVVRSSGLHDALWG